ncbi:hypothetical protein [Streptomyces enissocaesilis]
MDQTVTLLRSVKGEDERGNETWTDTETEVQGCSVQALDSVEYLSSADQIISRWQFLGPPGMGLKATDRIKVSDGEVYQVDGKPSVARSLSPFLSHTTAILKEVTG